MLVPEMEKVMEILKFDAEGEYEEIHKNCI
jgi:hypothetical protein